MTDRPFSSGSTRFGKGQSGNPKGRPRKPQKEAAAPAFDVLISKELALSRDGQQETVSLEEALQHQMLRDALAGKRMAQRKVLKMIEKRERARSKRMGHRAEGIKIVNEGEVPDNATDALLLLEIARQEEVHGEHELRLEPWAVQLAIDRMRGRSKIEQNTSYRTHGV